MKQTIANQKESRHNQQPKREQRTSAGLESAAITPPAYGIDFLDLGLPIQPNLIVGAAHNPYEQEADQLAQQVMSASESTLQAKPLSARITPLVQRQGLGGSFTAGAGFESRLASSRGGGQSLPGDTRQFMESRFGADFRGVRVHTDSESVWLTQEVSAQAFTHGQDIYMGAGQFAPGTDAGKRLLAHELTHTLQQSPAARSGSAVAARAIGQQVARNAGGLTIQRSFLGGVVRTLDLFNVLAPFRQFYLSHKQGVKIRAGSLMGFVLPFSHGILNKIDKVLAQIPPSHIRGNAELQVISGSEGLLGATSAYSDEDRTIHMQRPFRIVIPPWLYLLLDKGIRWQRSVMDQGFLGGLDLPWLQGDHKQIITSLHEELGLPPQQLEVMGGGQNALLENLVEWTIRHETGHAVDKKIGWKQNMSSLPVCGAWAIYPKHGAGLNPVAQAFLEKANIPATTYNRGTMEWDTLFFDFRRFLREMNPTQARDVDTVFDYSLHQSFNDNPVDQLAALKAKLREAVRYACVAMAQAWMRDDGGGDAVTYNGRTYQVDEYGEWCSFATAARAHRLSNYQFAATVEWFAEAYAAYYGTSEQRLQLPLDVRYWFRDNVDNA